MFLFHSLRNSQHQFPSCYTTGNLGQDNLGGRSQRAKAGELILRQVVSTAECGQHSKCSASCSLRYRNLSAVGAAASDFSVCDIGNHVDEANIKWGSRVDLNEECGWVVCELQWRASRRWWLQVCWWRWRYQGKLWQNGKRKLLRARDNEHLSEVVGVHSS